MDGQGDALIGVAVRNLTTSTGVITDIDGFYAIEAQKGEILEFSYVGYNTVKKEVANSFSISIVMTEDVQSLDEVVVVGMGTQRKASVIGSIASVRMADLKVPSRSLENALVGRMAGIIGVQRSGEPGQLADGVWQNTFKVRPEVLTAEEKKAWIATQTGVTVGSDAFFPFGDNVERARKSGVTYIAEPGGSIRDDHVIATADKYGMVNGMEAFGKTGTASDEKDLWFVGGTPYYVTAVWWGYDAPYDMTKTLTKQQAKTRTCVMAWKALMEQAQADLPYKTFPASSGVVERRYCTQSGLLAGSSCPSTAVGYYRADDLPDTCTYSHGASTQAADPAAPAEEAPQQTVIPTDTSNLDTD